MQSTGRSGTIHSPLHLQRKHVKNLCGQSVVIIGFLTRPVAFLLKSQCETDIELICFYVEKTPALYCKYPPKVCVIFYMYNAIQCTI